MPVFFDPAPRSALTPTEMSDFADELFDVCKAHIECKFGPGKSPLVFAIFAGSGYAHTVVAAMPPDIVVAALRDAIEAIEHDGMEITRAPAATLN